MSSRTRREYVEYRSYETTGRLWHTEMASYIYTLFDASLQRMLGYHWHPLGRGEETITKPHLHIYAAADLGGHYLPKLHLHTGMISLPDIVELLVEEFEVSPRRGNWRTILERCRTALADG